MIEAVGESRSVNELQKSHVNTTPHRLTSTIISPVIETILAMTKEACASLDKTKYGATVTSSALSQLGNVRWHKSTSHVDIYSTKKESIHLISVDIFLVN